jgi:hypothetical protein
VPNPLLPPPALLIGLSLAALPGAGAVPARPPASEAQMTLYTRVAALNVCIARAAAVDFDKAVSIAGETIAQLIEGEHGGVITVVRRQSLSLEELRKGAMNSAVIGAAEICPQQVPPEVLARVEAALRQADPAQGARPATTPAMPQAPSPVATPANTTATPSAPARR